MPDNHKTMRAAPDPVQPPSPRAGRWPPLKRAGIRGLPFVAATALALALLGGPAGAQGDAAPHPAKPASDHDQPGEPAAPPRPAATIDGFRDAHFGMTQEQLRGAIHKDFPGPAAKLKITSQPTEKTTVLTVSVPELLPNSSPAQISYILGYKSRRLIQVNVLWRSDGSEHSDEGVVGTANSLRDYFAAESYKPGSEIANRKLRDNAIIVFRAADAQDRMVLVMLRGAPAAQRKDEKAARPPPLTLEVSYVADPAHPDVFRIPKGEF